METDKKRRDAERKRLKRLEIKNDPERRVLEKEKERYIKRKEEGKLKSIKDISRRDQKEKRDKWVAARRKYVAKRTSSRHRRAAENSPVVVVPEPDVLL